MLGAVDRRAERVSEIDKLLAEMQPTVQAVYGRALRYVLGMWLLFLGIGGGVGYLARGTPYVWFPVGVAMIGGGWCTIQGVRTMLHNRAILQAGQRLRYEKSKLERQTRRP